MLGCRESSSNLSGVLSLYGIEIMIGFKYLASSFLLCSVCRDRNPNAQSQENYIYTVGNYRYPVRMEIHVDTGLTNVASLHGMEMEINISDGLG